MLGLGYIGLNFAPQGKGTVLKASSLFLKNNLKLKMELGGGGGGFIYALGHLRNRPKIGYKKRKMKKVGGI